MSEQLSFDTVPAPAEGRREAPTPIPAPFPPTGEQAAASGARDRDVFLEAGAGTGKTRVLVDRYCDAVDLDGIGPERVLAFTFTEKAAAEMRRRVRVELMRRSREAEEAERRERLRRAARAGEAAPIGTIHGFCRRLLAAHPAAAGLDPHFRVLDAEEAGRLSGIAFERALDRLAAADADVARLAAGYRARLRGLIGAAHDTCRNHGLRRPALPPLQITAFDGDDEPPDPGEVEQVDAAYGAMRSLLDGFATEYERVKADRSGVDFDDLQLLALELLEGSRPIAESYRERFDHVLVDELQDTSPLQIRLVGALRDADTRLFTVGDEFQSIYAFRGADLEGFRRERARAREQERSEVLPLTGSFRSNPDVVAAVNAIGETLLEGFRPLRVGRPPSDPARGAEGPAVELLLTANDGWGDEGIELDTATEAGPNRVAEARGLARRLRELADQGVEPRSMVLLLRAFTHVDTYAEALELAGLDPYVVGGRGYWSAQQVEDGMRLLSCVANPLDDEALFGALASPACGASADALLILRKAAGRGRHIWPAIAAELLQRAGSGEGGNGADGEAPVGATEDPVDESDPEARERNRVRREWIGRLPREDAERIGLFARRLEELRARAALLPLDTLVERTLETFDYDLAALAMPEGTRRAANLIKLVRIASEYEAHEGRDLRGFIEHATERTAGADREAEAATVASEHDGITVMTIHAAKGLEFDCVAVGDLGRGHTAGGAPPELRLDFRDEGSGAGDGRGARPAAGEGEGLDARVGLRLARPGASSLTVRGYQELSDEAAVAESQETGRLVYVAASRARERLLLSGLCRDRDFSGERELPARDSTVARLVPALGVGEEERQLVEVPPAEPRPGLEAGPFRPAPIAVSIRRASAEAAAALAYDLRQRPAAAGEPTGGRPPLVSLHERPASAVRNLSYAALADYSRCGYRFLTERLLGLGQGIEASGPLDPTAPERGGVPGGDEQPEGDDPANAPGGGLELGRAVHEMLDRSAREGWSRPGEDELAAALARNGAPGGEALATASAMLEGWLGSSLLAELVEARASFRSEVPFRVALGDDTVMRGTIDLLATSPGRAPVVIDYKTDATVPAGEADLPEAYSIQRSLYALAVSEATRAERVESVYVFLREPERPLRAELEGAEIERGRERIEGLVGGIRAGEFAATERPHAALCHDCPARARLCPHPPSRTLARA